MAAGADANAHPGDPTFLDEAEVRGALTAAFDACYGCRACADLCEVFPRLFDRLDQLPTGDAGGLTPAEQDHVVDACLHCGRCLQGCVDPTATQPQVDIPRLMLRAVAMRRAAGQQPFSQQVATRILVRTRGTATAPIGAPPGALRRKVAARAGGVSAVRVLPPRARERFSTWFARRSAPAIREPNRHVAIVPTCHVEYHDTQVGRDAVRVYERSGVTCSISAVACCGAPWLHAGELERFAGVAERNVALLMAEVRAGRELVVLQPTCLAVMRDHYPGHVSDGHAGDSRLLADRLTDIIDHVVGLYSRGELDTSSDTSSTTTLDTPRHAVTYHQSCPRQVRDRDDSTLALLHLAGAEVEVVTGCAGTGAMWGLRAPNAEIAVGFADRLVAEIARRDPTGASVVVSDCTLAATAIHERGGPRAIHPISLLAHRYGNDDGVAARRARHRNNAAIRRDAETACSQEPLESAPEQF